jgi:hypothetical protein
MLPVISLVVGLHFLPIARATTLSAFYYLAATLIAVAIFGMALPPPAGSALAGLASGAALWTAAVLAVRRDASVARA